MVDTHVNLDPTAEQIAEFTIAAAHSAALGLVPKVALLSHSNFGSSMLRRREDARALELLHERHPRWKLTAKCTAIARWTKRCARASADVPLEGSGQSARVPERRLGQHCL